MAERRNISKAETLKLADGSIYSGSQGLANKLIDAIGDEDTAKNWLVKEKGISKDLKIVSWSPKRNENGIFENPASLVWLFGKFGLDITPNAANELSKRIPQRLFLDGLISMWLNSDSMIDKRVMMR